MFFMVAILNNKLASTDRDYSPFYNSVFSVMAEERPSIIFVSCTMTSIVCNVSRYFFNSISKLLYIYFKKRMKIYSLKHCFE